MEKINCIIKQQYANLLSKDQECALQYFFLGKLSLAGVQAEDTKSVSDIIETINDITHNFTQGALLALSFERNRLGQMVQIVEEARKLKSNLLDQETPEDIFTSNYNTLKMLLPIIKSELNKEVNTTCSRSVSK